MLGIVIDENQPDYERGDFLVRPILGADAGQRRPWRSASACASDRPSACTCATARPPTRTCARRCGCRPRRSATSGAAGRCCSPATGAARTCSTSPTTMRPRSRTRSARPPAGFFCAGEIGPVGGRNFLHGFTATIAVFPDRAAAECRRRARRVEAPGVSDELDELVRARACRGPRRRRHHLRGTVVEPGARGAGADLAEAAGGAVRPRAAAARCSGRRAPRRSSGCSTRATGPTACPVEVASIAGPARALLAAERTALNLLAHLSGIATLTARFVDAVTR